MKTFHLKFNKEANGCWYIDFPNYPFAHHNLMMVAGADLLCEYAAKKEGHPDYAVIDVTLGTDLLEGREPDLVMERTKKGYGAYYRNCVPGGEAPKVTLNSIEREVSEAWICPVTLLVLHKYPKRINIYLK